MSEEKDKFAKRREEQQKKMKQLHKLQNSRIKPSTRSKLTGLLIALVVILVIGVIVFFEAGFVRRLTTAMKVGDEKVSTAEFDYYYSDEAITTYNTYYQYTNGQYLPFLTTKSLKKQAYNEDQTWADYFVEEAKKSVHNVKALVSAAKAEGMTLSAEGQANVDAQMTTYAAYAKQANLTVNQYLRQSYGRGVNEKLMRQIISDIMLASEYSEALKSRPEYTDEDLEAYYQSDAKENNTYVDIRYLAFSKTDDKTLEEAKAEAAAFIEGVKTADQYAEKAIAELTARAEAEDSSSEESSSEEGSDTETEITDTTARTLVSWSSLKNRDENLASWAFADERKASDTTVVELTDGSGYYAVFLDKTAYRQDYKTANIRQIFISVEDTEDTEAMEAAKTKAEGILDEWKAGAATEDSFAALADQYSELDLEGGLQEEVSNDSDAVGEWLFDGTRKAGDTAVIASDEGYHVIYYIGEGREYWKIQVEALKRNADYSAAVDALEEQYAASGSSFGIWLRDEPF